MQKLMQIRLLLFSLMILVHFPCHHCILIIESEQNEFPQPDAHFVIQNLTKTLNNLDNFTMCGRFNIYQFKVGNTSVVNGKYEYNTSLDLMQGIFPGFGTLSLVFCDVDDWSETLSRLH